MPTIQSTKQEVLENLRHHSVIILRGCQGAGKTTFISDIEEYLGSPYAPFEVVSADHYYVDDDGEYRWDPHLISQAHASCFENFEYFTAKLGDKAPIFIVVDNTNATMKEMQRYLDRAKKTGWDVVIVTFDTPPSVGAKRNIHNVPEDVVYKKYESVMATEIPENLTHYVIKWTQQ